MGTVEMLTAAGIGTGDEVVVPSYATTDAAEAVRRAGATPVFADIDPQSLCLDPASVAATLTLRTAAVMPVHLFGRHADLAGLRAVAEKRGLLVVEYEPAAPADENTRRRQENAFYLNTRLRGVETPSVPPGGPHGYRSYVVRVPGNGRPDRDAFARALRLRGVRCHVPVQTPVHRMPSFRRELWLTETERAADQCLALPMDASATQRELHRVVVACNALGGLLPAAV
ncbi:DegT/DnrJ/EryC1/StrS family aminotransferase [Streptomyces albireticuli]|uniref:DegT/DnrJ/EryC1/StrS aminotransferase n=1 Tax=Streptomyces albireticuli TaxID=1940 RepID=A0A2A2DFL5_9ACTN|nr:DegT/DnrJ/EryC1/StrS family aminotransferase [Streptomyces albireticuli]MCD9145625.1 DegT/DnrJ/EryC1/StrS family aminotransferase [Streptomyces albireticuli]MCD9165085.1 DegT/DnrJ/EryC1/StrS family aminotransferase [Streptomyces albireticuli]MCD9195614.1 DegT/DnrJ/EryC1/StrS family aminotransferase [Streptomyces albireticuli]PAU50266.1 DegT/DnrJ/EryC1/StrS aminotransferase [Streptomyces albireticuli]